MKIAAVGRALPENYYDQETLISYLEKAWEGKPAAQSRIAKLHRRVQVKGRHLALPLEQYADIRDFGSANDAWIPQALDLGEKAIQDAFDQVGLLAEDVDAIIFNSVTGIASPSIDARLVNRMGFRSDIKRTPIFGLGCVAGAAAVSRAADYVRAYPEQVVLVLTVELCSLTLQREDDSVANLISAGLFGDGASAALVVGAERARHVDCKGPEILDTRSVFYPDTEEVMGWKISEKGFQIQLSSAVPSVAREFLGGDVDRFLADQGMQRSDISSWVCHPGGPKVMLALQEALELEEDDIFLSWRNLSSMGNLSSASVLLILGDTIAERRPARGDMGLMLAMGPGFCSELLLLRWN